MEGRRGGSSTPSFKKAMNSKGKKPMENDRWPSIGKNKNSEEEQNEQEPKEKNIIKENEE